MNYDNPDLQHRLAAEYVLGTLHGAARLRFERLLTGNDGLRRKVAAWEARLSPWTAAVKPVPVPAHVWQGVQRRLGLTAAAGPAPASSGLSGLWRWWAFGSTALAAVFALLLVMRPAPVVTPAAPAWRDLAVLSTDKAEAVFIARTDGEVLEFSGLSKVSVPTDRDLELWAIPAKGAPLSLGVMHRNGRVMQVALDNGVKSRLAQGVALAISLEPTGGSPTGSPTGPVLYSGKLQG